MRFLGIFWPPRQYLNPPDYQFSNIFGPLLIWYPSVYSIVRRIIITNMYMTNTITIAFTIIQLPRQFLIAILIPITILLLLSLPLPLTLSWLLSLSLPVCSSIPKREKFSIWENLQFRFFGPGNFLYGNFPISCFLVLEFFPNGKYLPNGKISIWE